MFSGFAIVLHICICFLKLQCIEPFWIAQCHRYWPRDSPVYTSQFVINKLSMRWHTDCITVSVTTDKFSPASSPYDKLTVSHRHDTVIKESKAQ